MVAWLVMVLMGVVALWQWFMPVSRALGEEFSFLLRAARAERLQTMAEWAEKNIIIPDGPYVGRRFRLDRQPYSRLWFAAVDSGRWSRLVATGPQQSGKTLCCFVIPILYHIYEMKETVIVGLPDMNMANDKWREDILPAIMASPALRAYLPTRGEGSKGGQVKSSVKFRHGPTLKFMSGGGQDKKRSAFTSRVLVITETDGLDESGSTSREADKISQLEGRTRAFTKNTGPGARIYMECTVSTETGRTWVEYNNGTCSRIYIECPLCGEYVSPEREHLVGWQDAGDVVEAAELAAFVCPACGVTWNEDQRKEANAKAVLVHKGQRIIGADDPDTWEKTKAEGGPLIIGDLPKTDTLGFRWSGVNNCFVPAGDMGAEEWRGRLDPNPDNAEKKLRQWVWALPHIPDEIGLIPLDPEQVKRRVTDNRRGFVPKGCAIVTVGFDTGLYKCHWTAIAWRANGSGHVIDYGKFEPETKRLGEKAALTATLNAFRKMILEGWPTADGEIVIPRVAYIDSGYYEHTKTVYVFCRKCSGERTACTFLPSKGYGEGQQRATVYTAPTKKNKTIRFIGDNYHVSWLPADRLPLVHVNADYWKAFVHQRLAQSENEVGAMSLYAAAPSEHQDFVRQITAEEQVEKFVEGKGERIVWERTYRHNHYLDSTYNASAAGHHAGIRPMEQIDKSSTRTVDRWFSKLKKS